MQEFDSLRQLRYTGTQVNYYFVCKRKLWFFSHGIHMEQESDLVAQGKLLHEHSYQREKKEIDLGNVNLDWVDLKKCVIHEVKKSRAMEEAHTWQLLYYLYNLKSKGISVQQEGSEKDKKSCFSGELNYPKQKKRFPVILTKRREKEIPKILSKIEKIVNQRIPPAIEVRFAQCRKCSYCELCHS